VKIDDRFKNVLTDERFRVGTKDSVDKYGRKSKSKVTAADELKEFYQIEEEEGGEEEKEVSQEGSKKKTLNDVETRLDYLNKLARGEISGSSSDEDEVDVDEEESSSEDEESDLDESGARDPFEIPGDVVEESADVESNRIAIQNCDWENLTAEDIMYLPPLFVYPSFLI
jgi:hypothetical protein